MKLSDFKVEDLNQVGVDCNIYHPTSYEPTDITITVYGFDSKEFKTSRREAAKAQAKSKSKNDNFISHFIVANMIKSWENVEDDDGQIELTIDNAVKLFDACPFIFSQLEKFIDNSANFFLQK